MALIQSIKAREILDSRGNPTVMAEVTTEDGVFSAMVPSGASTGVHEALELRDKDKRYNGLGVHWAVDHVNQIIAPALKGKPLDDPSALDQIMIDLDGTKNKEKLGANAILAVSMALFRAAAGRIPLYIFLSNYFKTEMRMPVPMANVINGGKHADGDLYMQEFMLAPISAPSFKEATRMVAETYHTLKKVIKEKHGTIATHVGDEGGFAPPIATPEEALDLITEAINEAGYEGKIQIALDPAASEFFKDGKYHHRTPDEMIEEYNSLIQKYPIFSIEDPFGQDDFDTWAKWNPKIQVVGDDLTVSNVDRILIAAEKKLCNALLLKVNQIGSVTEAVRSAKMAYESGWEVMVSHRSGDTEDAFIADLAVALGCGQIKCGAPCRADRTSKYNRLLEIEEGLEGKYGLRKK
ncbi:MAG: phosphopyruvate hydratase [Nanoarchaeota archaeon]|nr:phosphopyruvate hydratase [Nanoarchaeota archaeon]